MPLLLPSGLLLFFFRTSAQYALCTYLLYFDWTLAYIQIFTDTLEMLAQMCEDAERDQPMLPLAQMGLMMVDWLDPQKVV